MELICYTVVLGGYDSLPTFRRRHPSVRCVCFTDTPSAFADPSGWEIVEVASYFQDRKLASGYLKSLSHRLFGEDVISLWVDAHLSEIDLVGIFEAQAIVAVPPHLLRSTVAEEAEEVVREQLEDASTTVRHLAFLRDQGFPDDVGLSSTTFLLRDHRDSRLRRANETWWGVISSGVRRDQLSFDYALWAAGLQPYFLDADWRAPNRFFVPGEHLSPVGRRLSDSASERSYWPELNFPAMPPGYPRHISYFPEQVSSLESRTHRDLNAIVAAYAQSGVVEGNYCHFDQARLNRFTPADPRRSWKREYLRSAVKGRYKALEIGFNAGHSAAIMLCSQPDLVLHSVDIASHPYTVPCADRLKSLFPERFALTVGDSRLVLAHFDLAEFDFVHVDGGHEEDSARSDLELFFNQARPGALLMVDDAYVPHIARILADAMEEGCLDRASPDVPSSGENVLFRKREAHSLRPKSSMKQVRLDDTAAPDASIAVMSKPKGDTMRLDQAAARTWDTVRSIEETSAVIHDGAVSEGELRRRGEFYVSDLLYSSFPQAVPPIGASIMEIGSGLGRIMEAMEVFLRKSRRPARSIIGLDIAANMISQAQQRIGPRQPFQFLHYDGVTIPLEDGSLDSIYSAAALQHIPRPYVFNLFFEMRRLLKPTGFAVFHLLSTKCLPLQETHHSWRAEISNQISLQNAHWHHFYTQEELTDVLAITGFPYVSVAQKGHALICCVSNSALRLPEDFSPREYLRFNRDVANAGDDPEVHWLTHGHREGRRWK